MFAVIFEVEPKPDRWDDYLAQARALAPVLAGIDGFLEVRRHRGRADPGRLLSLSLWRDEKSVIRWRREAAHHAAQQAGRAGIFNDYRLRVAEVTHDDGAPLPRMRMDLTETATPAALSILMLPPGVDAPPLPARAIGSVLYDDLNDPGRSVALMSWPDLITARFWQPHMPGRRLEAAVIRAYGMHDRAEAPQFHPPVG